MIFLETLLFLVGITMLVFLVIITGQEKAGNIKVISSYVVVIHGALYLASIITFTQVIMVAALMLRLKMVILCFT